MAELKFTGTTQEVLLAITATDIGSDTKVTITDNQYTLANLLTIVGTATTYPVVLQKTAAAVAIEGTATQLKNMLAGVDKYTGALKATDALGVSAADLNTIAAGTTGKVTATLAPATTIEAATVAALKDVKATDAITFKTTDTDLDGNAEINALISLNKILPKADWSNIASIEGTANDVSIIKQALAIAKNKDLTVEITGAKISAEDANAIAKLAGGALTATIKDGSVAATLKALANVNASDTLTFTSTDKTVKATDLVALKSKIATGTYASIETITADAKDVSYVSAALAIAPDKDVTITGTITAAQANTIADATNGVVTAIVEADTAANLVAKLGDTDTNDMLTLAVNGTTATAANLNTLATVATGGKIKLDATEVTGTFVQLEGVYVTNKASFTALGNENVTITGPNPTAAELNTIAAATTGKVTATLDPTTDIEAATVTALKDVKATDSIIFVTSDTDLVGKDDLNALLAIKKLIPNANFKNIVTIDADAKDVALVKSVLKDVAANVAVTITGDISAADANAIAKGTTGALTATIKDGSVAATLKALKDVDGADVLTFTSTDKTVKATDLVDLDSKIANGTYTSIETITGDAKDTADIKDALDNIVTANNPEVKISGIVANDDANIADILDGTTAKVTAKIEAGRADVLAGLLANGTDDDALDVTVNGDSALATDLAAIDASTGSKVKVDAKEVTGDFTNLNTLYFTNKAHFSNLGNEDVEITGGANSALNVDTILKATTGVVTAEVTGDKANILVSQLKNANAKDALDITVLTDANGTSAKDLIALTKKTSEVVDASAITTDGIVGSVADINAVIKAEADLKLDLNAAVAYSVTGTITAAQADAIADTTTGVVTATIAAGTAAALNAALSDGADVNAYTLKVNGTTAAALDLIALNGKTDGKITVDAKEITGTAANVTIVLNTVATEISGQEKAAVKVTDPTVAAGTVNTILATTGVVTATVTADSASALNTALVNATAEDKLTLRVTNEAAAALTNAADLLALDDKTAVKVDATGITNGITGTAADVKKLLASKGVDVSKTTDINLSDLVVKAADVSSVAKATSGVVTAKVEADTAAKLNAALTDKDENALTLTVNGTTATAKDLISLDGKTSVDIILNVGAITGNIDEITKVFVTDADNFTYEETTAATISGEITAAQADAIADATSGVVTATIKADSAAVLNTVLVDLGSQVNAYKLTVNGTTADAAHLNALDGKTSVAVNAAAIKNIEGNGVTGAADVKAAYEANALKTISGLGNETVDLSGATDANASLVKAINDYTTGVITLNTLKTATAGGNFSLSELGDLNGIAGLANINANNGVADVINISLKDLLAANDSKGDFTFSITGGTGDTDTVNISNDVSGWTKTEINPGTEYTYRNDKTGVVVTIEATDAVITA
ncbi:beta strand repeat-containing protein [Aliarcobacter butzleri]|uniref:beta strand repeat-containing protein n=1 Tax=Aliarcobacter butzleri TaxID=28197 RepID=UPI003B20CCA7